MAGIAGSNQADQTTDVTYWAAGTVNTGFARGTATDRATFLTSRAARRPVETGFAGVTAHPVTAVVRTTLSAGAARNAGIVTA